MFSSSTRPPPRSQPPHHPLIPLQMQITKQILFWQQISLSPPGQYIFTTFQNPGEGRGIGGVALEKGEGLAGWTALQGMSYPPGWWSSLLWGPQGRCTYSNSHGCLCYVKQWFFLRLGVSYCWLILALFSSCVYERLRTSCGGTLGSQNSCWRNGLAGGYPRAELNFLPWEIHVPLWHWQNELKMIPIHPFQLSIECKFGAVIVVSSFYLWKECHLRSFLIIEMLNQLISFVDDRD